MSIDLYYSEASTQCTAIRMVAAALKVDLNLKLINLFIGEHLTPEFVELNPQHTIPTLVDDGFVVWETRAILIYLIENYGPTNDSLFPSGPQIRATINQRLYFDVGTLYRYFDDAVLPQVFHKRAPSSEVLNKAQDAVELLNTFLEGREWLAGDSVTVADYALSTTMMGMQLLDVDLSYAGNIKQWLGSCKDNLAGWELIEANAELLKGLLSPKS